jgi:aspartate racemase
MDGPVYRRALPAAGVAVEVPSAEDKLELNRIIFDELVAGRFTDRSRAFYVGVIEKLARKGCDGVALVCTEIPLLVTQDVSPLPILDSTRLLARAAVDVSLGVLPMPAWRGGPVGTGAMAGAA